MTDQQEPRLCSADVSHIRQWMELVNEFLTSMSLMHYGNRPGLPKDHDHKLRVMKVITQALSVPSTDIDTPYRYHCNSCGHDFTTMGSRYFLDGFVDCCPKCHSGLWQITDNLAQTAIIQEWNVEEMESE